jgi:hypothetical protein
MVRQLALVPATFAVGWVAHKAGNLRAVLVVLAVAAFLLMAGYGISYGFGAILALTLVWGIAWSPTMALYERILVVEAGMLGFPYASLRLWGRSAISSAPSYAASPSITGARPGCSMSFWRASLS